MIDDDDDWWWWLMMMMIDDDDDEVFNKAILVQKYICWKRQITVFQITHMGTPSMIQKYIYGIKNMQNSLISRWQ